LLKELFASDATYVAAPFEPPIRGLAAIASFWEAERESADEVFALAWETIAVEDDLGVARVEVRYSGPPVRIYRDLWIVSLGEDRRCISFEEWPFFPGQVRVSTDVGNDDRCPDGGVPKGSGTVNG